MANGTTDMNIDWVPFATISQRDLLFFQLPNRLSSYVFNSALNLFPSVFCLSESVYHFHVHRPSKLGAEKVVDFGID